MIRRSLLLLLVAACTDPSGPTEASDAAAPPPQHAANLEVHEQYATELGLRWDRGIDDSGRYWLTHNEGTEPPRACEPGPRLVTLDQVTTARVSGLAPSTSYAFRLCPADDRSGTLTIDPGITAIGVTLALPPGEPADVQLVETSPGTFGVSWTAGMGATGYIVAYAEGPVAPADCFGTTVQHATSTALELAGLPTNRTYAVRVCAKNNNPIPDLSAGVTATAFMHSPLAPNPSALAAPTTDAEWAKLAWTTTSAEVRIAVQAGAIAPPAGCMTATEVVQRASLVVTNLQPSTTYQVRICASNGDSMPLYSAGTTLSFTTRARVVPNVNGLSCVDAGGLLLKWKGPGPATSYHQTRIAEASGMVPPLCTNTTPTAGAYQGSTDWRLNSGGALGDRFWVRICYRLPSGQFDQGQVMHVTNPYTVGTIYNPGSCEPAEDLASPTLTMIATTAVVQDRVTVSGTCTVSGTTIRIDGDVAPTTATCGANHQWTATGTVTALGDGPIRIAATAWHDTRFQSVAAFVSVTKQCEMTGSTCGDGVVDAGEACDLGCGNGDDRACTSQCQIAVCGDGLLGPDEECDQGANNADSGTCMTDCRRQVCGNGVVGGGEQCDLGAANATSGACTPSCTVQRCGDGLLGATEQCDNGAGNYSLTGTCTPACTTQVCGDGYRGAGEQCDAGAQNADTGFCRTGCQLAVCGDGVVSPVESCDGTPGCPADCGVTLPYDRISVGTVHGIGLRGNGSVSGWGYASYFAGTPAGAFESVSAGVFFSCGMRTDHTGVCWGQDSNGTPNAPAVPAGTLLDLDGGYSAACAVLADGTATCFGPQAPAAPAGTFTQVAIGTYGACGIRTDGTIDCWGTAYDPPAGAGTFTRVATSGTIVCGVRTNRSLACWSNTGYTTQLPGPYTDVIRGSAHTCALTAGADVECFGSNSDGQSTPAVGTFLGIAGERDSTCGLRIDGTVACWGRLGSPTGTFLP